MFTNIHNLLRAYVFSHDLLSTILLNNLQYKSIIYQYLRIYIDWNNSYTSIYVVALK